MEVNRRPLKKKLLSINEEKLVREVNYEDNEKKPCSPKIPFCLELEVLQKKPYSHLTQRVTVSVKPRVANLKTLFVAEKQIQNSEKTSNKSTLQHAIGDHASSSEGCSKNDKLTISVSYSPDRQGHKRNAPSEPICTSSASECSDKCVCETQTSNIKNARATLEKCYVQNQSNMNPPKIESLDDKSQIQNAPKIDKATLIVTKTSSEDFLKHNVGTIDHLNKRLEYLEREVQRQQAIIYPIGLSPTHSSDIEEGADDTMKSTSMTGRPQCSYIDQYSHIPGTSAFQRYAQQTSPLSLNRGSTGRTQERQRSEQYGRDFTTYDGITSRGRRQCASVPCKRNEVPDLHDRGKSIRHKLNPVHDYRLMDTVHYLAQGEFAPRDDGIKLTSSREAVLSDIIWEDVCRTHWPNARLSRRTTHYDRRSTRSELQRLIDGLLRERVSHIERKRRRHYKVVRLNHGHTSCRPLGKTGDVIVASHKKPDERDVAGSERDATCRLITERQREEHGNRRYFRSQDRITQETQPKLRLDPEDSPPGTSRAAARCPNDLMTSCCQRNPHRSKRVRDLSVDYVQCPHELSSSSNASTSRHHVKPRLLVKKDSRRMYHKDSPKMDHYILLPTLVVRTPSNLKRQRKFNELYHRIQHVKNKDSNANNQEKKEMGTNFNISQNDSDDNSNTKNR